MNAHLTEAEIIQLRTELEQPDHSMFIIGYALAAVSGSLFTVVCLGVGIWVRGL